MNINQEQLERLKKIDEELVDFYCYQVGQFIKEVQEKYQVATLNDLSQDNYEEIEDDYADYRYEVNAKHSL